MPCHEQPLFVGFWQGCEGTADGYGVAVPMEAIVALRRRLAALPIRHPERLALMDLMAKPC
ncbi:hypothetical protein E4Q23_21515 [Candidatus Accumulibacter phosphatis]|jgi:hypothetical protein|uniref:Uncharacterized protein n=1 Tax=Candidatus Accumulibacter phosphatis TaxID=327160 RepID=A0ABX1U0P9_9PROT|nr:hypothetical protein [Candidatus Accumulibacter phosphatis]NMQ30104.1 hypothetical protein [Candidatus Accumulibacter phosphatis]